MLTQHLFHVSLPSGLPLYFSGSDEVHGSEITGDGWSCQSPPADEKHAAPAVFPPCDSPSICFHTSYSHLCGLEGILTVSHKQPHRVASFYTAFLIRFNCLSAGAQTLHHNSKTLTHADKKGMRFSKGSNWDEDTTTIKVTDCFKHSVSWGPSLKHSLGFIPLHRMCTQRKYGTITFGLVTKWAERYFPAAGSELYKQHI